MAALPFGLRTAIAGATVILEESVRKDSTGAKAVRVLDRRLDRAERHLPARFAEWLAHLRKPSASWLRVPLGFLLVAGGLLGFLPVLGFWMLPMGVVLLSLDFALLRRPTARTLVSGERHWRRFRRRSRNAAATGQAADTAGQRPDTTVGP